MDTRDKKGRTPLFHAAERGENACVIALLDEMQNKKIDIHEKDDKGITPVIIAASKVI